MQDNVVENEGPYPAWPARARWWLSVLVGSAAVWLWAEGRPLRAADATAKEEFPDLTGLSLEELYRLDMVQLNVLTAHTHPQGQVMLGYRFMYMENEGYLDGSRELSGREVFGRGFPTIHTRMQMWEHMFDAMYAFTDRLTVMGMVPYREMSMKHLTSSGMPFTQSASGIGDIELMGSYVLFGPPRGGGHRLMLNGGFSIPTGSVEVRDHMNGISTAHRDVLEYPMQLGSGTYDLLPGLTYLGEHGPWSWGVQTMEHLRLGRNERGYRFGNQYMLSGWAAYGVTDWFAPYLRLEGRLWDNLSGRDREIDPLKTPEGGPDRQGGTRADAVFGISFYSPKGKLKGLRLALEGGVPIYQDLDGPQLSQSYRLTAGLTYEF